jgi:hypothetical protein
VLGAGQDPGRPEPAREGDGVSRDGLGIPREGSIADHRVVRVRVDVADGREVEVDPERGEGLVDMNAVWRELEGRRELTDRPISDLGTAHERR